MFFVPHCLVWILIGIEIENIFKKIIYGDDNPELKHNTLVSEMGGLFSKEKKSKPAESKVTEQDKAILVSYI